VTLVQPPSKESKVDQALLKDQIRKLMEQHAEVNESNETLEEKNKWL